MTPDRAPLQALRERVSTALIAAAAIRWRGETFSMAAPARHHDVIALIRRERPNWGPVPGWAEQGFITNSGAFVDREMAGKIAVEAGQVESLKWPPSLFSEDLW